MTWLSFASRRLRGVGLADPIFGIVPDDPEETRAARVAFRILDDHLMIRGVAGARWLVGRTPTIADVAVFPALAMSAAAGLDLDPYTALRGWLSSMRQLPGFVAVPSMHPTADEGPHATTRRLPRPVRAGNVIALSARQQRQTDSAT